MIPWELLGRILVAAILGGTIGLERDRRGRPAGLRTHMIVALASATFMVVSTYFLRSQHYRPGEPIDVDVSRIAAAIVTGIGFLGGGAIMRTGVNVHGLTTAAGLWLVGAIGMAAGGGMYVVALFSTGLGLLALDVLRRLEDKDDVTRWFRADLSMQGVTGVDDLVARLERIGARSRAARTERDLEHQALEVHLDIGLPRTADPAALTRALEEAPGVRRVRVESLELPPRSFD